MPYSNYTIIVAKSIILPAPDVFKSDSSGLKAFLTLMFNTPLNMRIFRDVFDILS